MKSVHHGLLGLHRGADKNLLTLASLPKGNTRFSKKRFHLPLKNILFLASLVATASISHQLLTLTVVPSSGSCQTACAAPNAGRLLTHPQSLLEALKRGTSSFTWSASSGRWGH